MALKEKRYDIKIVKIITYGCLHRTIVDSGDFGLDHNMYGMPATLKERDFKTKNLLLFRASHLSLESFAIQVAVTLTHSGMGIYCRPFLNSAGPERVAF